MFYFLEFSCLKIESWLFLFCVFSDIFSFSCSLYVTYYCGCPFLVKICSLTSRYIDDDDDDDDADLHYADSYEREQADIDPDGYQNLFGDSDSEDFNGF